MTAHPSSAPVPFRHGVTAAFWLLPTLALAGTFSSGEIVIVEDTTGSIHNSMFLQSSFCQDAAKGLYVAFPDKFDGIVSFSQANLSDLQNVQQGTPVKTTAQGIGRAPWDNRGQYGNPAKLSQCVFMGSLPKLPNNPDGPATALFGLPLGITGVELLGHEYGHHWLLSVTFDKNDGKGKRDLLRGYEENTEDPSQSYANQHWSYYANSVSPMYGSKITQTGPNSFKLEGADRKYTELDQYLMGLRAPSEVSPMFALDDGSGHGKPSVPIGKNAPGQNVNNVTRVDFTIDDVIRSEGARNPAYPNAQSCWRVAFVYVTEKGKTATPAELAKIDAYRLRFENWFRTATDNRGTMDTRLNGNGCIVPGTPDAGTPMDAGTPSDAGVTPDAGSTSDAGMTVADAGMQPVPDAGITEGPGTGGAGGGGAMVEPDPMEEESPETIRLKRGCGCGADGGSPPWVWLMGFAVLAGLVRKRRLG